MSNWQSSSNYDYIDHLTASGIAWEFLRRNEDYRRDYAEFQQGDQSSPALSEQAGQQWGLRYPGESHPERDRD